MNVLIVTARVPKENGQGDQSVSYQRLKHLSNGNNRGCKKKHYKE